MTTGAPMPAVPSCFLEPLWVQFSALLPQRQVLHRLGCHRPRIPDRVVFDKLIQMLRFGCSYREIADQTCSATTLRNRRNEWLEAGVFQQLERIVLETYDSMIGLELTDLAVDGCITKAPCGGECAGRSPVDRGKQGIKRSTLIEARGIPLGAVLAPASRHDSVLLPSTLDKLAPGRRPSRPPCTSTGATTTPRPRPSWPPACCRDRSRSAANRRPYRLASAGRWNAPTPGSITSASWLAAPNAWPR